MPLASGPRVVWVLPDVRGLARRFAYVLPDDAPTWVTVGSEVRIDLHGRRVGGWVTDVDAEPPPGVTLRPVSKVRGHGPAADVLTLAEWAAWRWAGPTASFLRTASASAVVSAPRSAAPPPRRLARPAELEVDLPLADSSGATLLRLPPAFDRLPMLAWLAAEFLQRAPGAAASSVLLVCPSTSSAARLAAGLGRAGLPVAHLSGSGGRSGADEWAAAAGGGRVVVGARATAWAPAPALACAVVVDSHDEAHQEERAPTWHARDVVVERCRRAGVPAFLLSPCPTLEDEALGELVRLPPAAERGGWPTLEVIDRRDEDPATAGSMVSPRLAALVRDGGRVVCVLNRVGRARLLACRACGSLASCATCGAAVGQPDGDHLACRRCGATRPLLCSSCGSTALKVVRAAVGRVREELAALVGEEVDEVTTSTDVPPKSRVLIGTEAVLHRVGRVDVVAFCDFDQELTAPHLRAAERAFALLARAGRLVGGRAGAGRVLVQSRQPDHVVLRAASAGDPALVREAETAVRRDLQLPPFAALARISGQPAAAFAAALPAGRVTVQGPLDDAWLVRAPTHADLADALASVSRPAGRLRVEVDPPRV